MAKRNAVLVLALLAFCGCAAFRSGAKVSGRERDVFSSASAPVFGRLETRWLQTLYASDSQLIADFDAQKRVEVPRPVQEKEAQRFRGQAQKLFVKSGIYAPDDKLPVLTLTLTSRNRWTYKILAGNFLVETAYVFILPAGLMTEHTVKAEWELNGVKCSVKETGAVKTYFHFLLLPLYPFSAPSNKESSVIKKLLLKTAVRIKEQTAVTAPPVP